MNRLWILLTLLLITSPVLAQNFGGSISGPNINFANTTFTDTSKFTGSGPLGASDTTVQRSLQTLNASGATLILACQTTDDFCFVYEDNLLKLYVNSTLQAQWPSAEVIEFLLLENGDFILLENGDKIIIE